MLENKKNKNFWIPAFFVDLSPLYSAFVGRPFWKEQIWHSNFICSLFCNVRIKTNWKWGPMYLLKKENCYLCCIRHLGLFLSFKVQFWHNSHTPPPPTTTTFLAICVKPYPTKYEIFFLFVVLHNLWTATKQKTEQRDQNACVSINWNFVATY